MTYDIEQVQGIGAQFGLQLMTSGVTTTQELLDKCGTVDKMRQLEAVTGISAKQLATWAHQADLMRVQGIGPEFGQLLERSGVESVGELAMRHPENITHLLARVNAEKKLTRAVPALKTVTGWVERAKIMMKESSARSGTPTASAPTTSTASASATTASTPGAAAPNARASESVTKPMMPTPMSTIVTTAENKSPVITLRPDATPRVDRAMSS
jgi:predicted flap endonuclease-1-like 5' DNA nuclease